MLIAGLPGTGKTTLVQGLADRWGRSNCNGFLTQELREHGRRIGFSWETFRGEKGILADLKPGQPRIGKYRVDLESFERMLSNLLDVTTARILMIDEVGKMECLSEKFRDLLPSWEKADGQRIFTVPVYGTPFIEAFKARNKAHLILLTPHNRDELFERITRL